VISNNLTQDQSLITQVL